MSNAMEAEVTYPLAHELVDMELAKQDAAGTGDGPDLAHIHNALRALENPRYRRRMIAEWQEKHGAATVAANLEEVGSTCT